MLIDGAGNMQVVYDLLNWCIWITLTRTMDHNRLPLAHFVLHNVLPKSVSSVLPRSLNVFLF